MYAYMRGTYVHVCSTRPSQTGHACVYACMHACLSMRPSHTEGMHACANPPPQVRIHAHACIRRRYTTPSGTRLKRISPREMVLDDEMTIRLAPPPSTEETAHSEPPVVGPPADGADGADDAEATTDTVADGVPLSGLERACDFTRYVYLCTCMCML